MKPANNTADSDTVFLNKKHGIDSGASIPARSSLPLALSQLLFAGLFALMLWSAVAQDILIYWLCTVVLVVTLDLFVRWVLVLNFDSWRRRGLWIFTLDVITGLLWLFAAISFFPVAHENLRFFYLFGLGAPALCTAVYQHYRLTGCFARIGLAMPVAALYMLKEAQPFGALQAALVFSIWVSIIWLATRLHQLLIQRLELTHNRDVLLEKVADNTRELAALQTKEADSRQQAETANLAKSRFLAHSSHDLRQPLHAISLLLETIDEDELDKSSRHVVSRVRHSVDLLAKLFDSLLDLTLLDTGQVTIEETVFDLDNVLRDVADDLASVAAANGTEISLGTSRLHVRGDPTVVRRMTQNLMANAIRHAPNGKVTLRARQEEGTVYIDVQDNGCGIALEDQQRIFQEFTKLDTQSNEQSTSTLGLGLAIVNRLARLTETQVSVTSKLDQGSVFSIGPFPVSSVENQPPLATRKPIPELNRVHVVVVDDDQDTLKATGELLAKWGFSVTLLEGGHPDQIPKPDVLVCDFELGPGLTGVDLISGVRDYYGEIVPALLISGNTTPKLAALAVENDLRLLRKPVRPAQLKSALLTLLGTASRDT